MFLLIQFLNFSSVLSGLLVITAESPIASVLYLILLFICVACYLIFAGMPYFGVVYIVVYVGAIAILFIFIIMMMDLQHSDLVDTSYEFNLKLPITLILASGFFLEISYMVKETFKHIEWINIPESFFSKLNFGIANSIAIFSNNVVKANTYFFASVDSYYENQLSQLQHIQIIGESLYTQNAFWLLLSSLLFLLGMLSPIVLSKKTKTN